MNKKISWIFLIAIFSCLIFMNSCNRPSEGSFKAGEHIQNTVVASTETEPVPQNKNEDSADDPAIWVNSVKPEESIIIGTDKKGGIATYNLQGEELYYYFTGNMNNCDLRYGFRLNGDTIDILAATNRSFHSFSLFRIHKNGMLDTLHSQIFRSEMKDEVYGLAMYKSKKTGKFYVFVNSKAGEVEQWELFDEQKRVSAKRVCSFSMGAQTEGMVADDETGVLYVGKEEAGIWKLDAEPGGEPEGAYIENSSEENLNIKYDIEGLAIYDSGNGDGYLVASSQGNYSYAIFERQGNNKYLGSFRITDGEIDGVEETDGLDITSVPLPGFPRGILVVQDGFNYDGRKKKSQNFKIVSWDKIDKIIRSGF
ncbi:MAG: phytase [Prolixibacteraceae bacterium]|nr:phytase [Prolixibacteraceae bacterium]